MCRGDAGRRPSLPRGSFCWVVGGDHGGAFSFVDQRAEFVGVLLILALPVVFEGMGAS